MEGKNGVQSFKKLGEGKKRDHTVTKRKYNIKRGYVLVSKRLEYVYNLKREW